MSPTSSLATSVGRRAAHVARLQAVAPAAVEVHRDLDLRHVHLQLDVQVGEPVDVRDSARSTRRPVSRSSSGPAPKMRTTIGSLGAGEHLLDALVQVGLHVVVEPG